MPIRDKNRQHACTPVERAVQEGTSDAAPPVDRRAVGPPRKNQARLGTDINTQHSPAPAAALAATGIIWCRYATQIVPINYNLMSVNFFVALTGLYQLGRKNKSPRHPETLSAEPRTIKPFFLRLLLLLSFTHVMPGFHGPSDGPCFHDAVGVTTKTPLKR